MTSQEEYVTHPFDTTRERDHANERRQRKSILVVEDEPSIRAILLELFSAGKNNVVGAELLSEALSELRSQQFDLVVTDLRLAGKRDGGLQVLALAGMLSPDAMVLVLTAYPDDSNRQASFRLGAMHLLEKPVDLAIIARHAASIGIETALGAQTHPAKSDSGD